MYMSNIGLIGLPVGTIIAIIMLIIMILRLIII
jgi:hypothetical protein